jgi:hypothetical protein
MAIVNAIRRLTHSQHGQLQFGRRADDAVVCRSWPTSFVGNELKTEWSIHSGTLCRRADEWISTPWLFDRKIRFAGRQNLSIHAASV